MTIDPVGGHADDRIYARTRASVLEVLRDGQRRVAQRALDDGHRASQGRGLSRPCRRAAVGTPRRNVATTRPGSVMPAYGVLRLSEADSVGSTTRVAVASWSTRFAGSPTASGRPCPATRPISAGFVDIRWATSSQVSSPVSTIVCCTTESAVSRPSMPNAAAAHSQSLSSCGCGAWSVATMSIVPSASPARTASTSAARAQRRVDLVDRVVRRGEVVGEQQVVRA